MSKDYSVKSCKYQLKDLDEKNKIVKAVVSAFGNKDHDGDIIPKGAFKKTIQERGPEGTGQIKMLWQHNVMFPVGKTLELEETSEGLIATTQMSGNSKAQDVIEDYKLDLFEHSIGFDVIKEHHDEKRDANILSELKLWEYSAVTWGANSQTPLVEMKGRYSEDELDRVNEYMRKFTKALRKGNYTDERFEEIEILLKQCQQAYNDIISSLRKSSDNGTPTKSDNNEDQFFTNLKL